MTIPVVASEATKTRNIQVVTGAGPTTTAAGAIREASLSPRYRDFNMVEANGSFPNPGTRNGATEQTQQNQSQQQNKGNSSSEQQASRTTPSTPRGRRKKVYVTNCRIHCFDAQRLNFFLLPTPSVFTRF